MSICGAIKRAYATHQPRPRPPVDYDADGPVADLYWIPRHLEDKFHEVYGKKNRISGMAYYDSNELFVMERYTPRAHRLPDNIVDHAAYYEALPTVKAKELHLHEGGHAFMSWPHDTGHPVMDGLEDGSRVPLGKRTSKAERKELFARYTPLFPGLRVIEWQPHMDRNFTKGDDVY